MVKHVLMQLYLRVPHSLSLIERDPAYQLTSVSQSREGTCQVSNLNRTWIKRVGCRAWCQRVSRCRTRDESEESIPRRRQSTQGMIPPSFETQCIGHQESKTAVSVTPQKGLMSSNFVFFLSLEYLKRESVESSFKANNPIYITFVWKR